MLNDDRKGKPTAYWFGDPTEEYTTRLWRDAAARREESCPRFVVDVVLELITVRYDFDECMTWMRTAWAVHLEGGMDRDTVDAILWEIAGDWARSREDELDPMLARIETLQATGIPDLAESVTRDPSGFVRRVEAANELLHQEARRIRAMQKFGWAPPGEPRAHPPHQVFRDALAGGESAYKRVASAGLAVLMLVDRGTAGIGPDSSEGTAARSALMQLDPASELHRALLALVNYFDRGSGPHDDEPQTLLLAAAEAYRAIGAPLLAADICYRIVRGGEFCESSVEPPARDMLREIEDELKAQTRVLT